MNSPKLSPVKVRKEQPHGTTRPRSASPTPAQNEDPNSSPLKKTKDGSRRRSTRIGKRTKARRKRLTDARSSKKAPRRLGEGEVVTESPSELKKPFAPSSFPTHLLGFPKGLRLKIASFLSLPALAAWRSTCKVAAADNPLLTLNPEGPINPKAFPFSSKSYIKIENRDQLASFLKVSNDPLSFFNQSIVKLDLSLINDVQIVPAQAMFEILKTISEQFPNLVYLSLPTTWIRTICINAINLPSQCTSLIVPLAQAHYKDTNSSNIYYLLMHASIKNYLSASELKYLIHDIIPYSLSVDTVIDNNLPHGRTTVASYAICFLISAACKRIITPEDAERFTSLLTLQRQTALADTDFPTQVSVLMSYFAGFNLISKASVQRHYKNFTETIFTFSTPHSIKYFTHFLSSAQYFGHIDESQVNAFMNSKDATFLQDFFDTHADTLLEPPLTCLHKFILSLIQKHILKNLRTDQYPALISTLSKCSFEVKFPHVSITPFMQFLSDEKFLKALPPEQYPALLKLFAYLASKPGLSTEILSSVIKFFDRRKFRTLGRDATFAVCYLHHILSSTNRISLSQAKNFFNLMTSTVLDNLEPRTLYLVLRVYYEATHFGHSVDQQTLYLLNNINEGFVSKIDDKSLLPLMRVLSVIVYNKQFTKERFLKVKPFIADHVIQSSDSITAYSTGFFIVRLIYRGFLSLAENPELKVKLEIVQSKIDPVKNPGQFPEKLIPGVQELLARIDLLLQEQEDATA